MTCTAITRRNNEGPCEYEGDHFEGVGCGDEPEDNWQKHYGPCEDSECGDYHHAYLGPVLARCGHLEGEHGIDGVSRAYCDSCVEVGEFHTYTEEPT